MIRHFKKETKSMRKYKRNKPAMHPALKIVILLAIYASGYICGSINLKQPEPETVIKENIIQEQSETETISNNSSDNELIASKYTITYDISYSELNKNEKEFYDKVISTAMNKDNTFITDKELNFNFNTTITENESLRVQSVLYNDYPDITIYTTRYPDSWMYYITHFINGLPTYRTYYFNVRYKQ